MISKDILAILRCPVTGQSLTLQDGDGKDPCLKTADGARCYPLVNGIAMLLAEDAKSGTANGV